MRIAGGFFFLPSFTCFYTVSQVLCVFSLADRGGALPPSLLLEELDAIVDVKLDGPPVPLVAHQQGAEFQAALAVCFGRNAQIHEVPLQVSLHGNPLRLWPGTLQDASLPWEGRYGQFEQNKLVYQKTSWMFTWFGWSASPLTGYYWWTSWGRSRRPFLPRRSPRSFLLHHHLGLLLHVLFLIFSLWIFRNGVGRVSRHDCRTGNKERLIILISKVMV